MKYSEIIQWNKNKIFCNSLNEKDYLSNENLDISVENGFGLSYTKHKSNGGRYVLRNQLNSLGKVGSIFQHKRKSGVVPTFNSEFAELIGGYPKGAILWNINSKEQFRVVSLIDDNKIDFTKMGIDGVSWQKIYAFNSDNFNSITNIREIFSYTGNIPGVQELGHGIVEKTGALILESYLKKFGTNLNMALSPFGNWLSLYVSDIDIRGKAQKYCITKSRFIMSKFGDLDDTKSSIPTNTNSLKKQTIIVKKGCYWSLWSNFSRYVIPYVWYEGNNDYWVNTCFYNNSNVEKYMTKFVGEPFEGYIKLYQG